MRTTISLTRRLLTSTVVFGALSVATVGMAGQAGASTTTPTTAHGATPGVQAHRHLVCTNAQKRHAKRVESGQGLSKRLTTLEAREAKAKAAGHQARAAYLAKVIAHDQAVRARLGKRLTTMQSRIAAMVARRCGAAARSTT